MAEAPLSTCGDSSDKMIAPRVSTWMTFADGKEGVFEDIRARGLQRLSRVYQIYERPNIDGSKLL